MSMESIETLCESLSSISSICPEARLSLLRELRAAATTSVSAANNIVKCIVPSLITYAVEAERSAEDKTMICIVCQIVANSLAHGAGVHECFFSACNFTSLLHLLVAAAQAGSRNGIAAVIASVHSFITHDPTSTETFLAHRELLTQLCLSLLRDTDSSSDPVLEWMQLLIVRLCEQNHLLLFITSISTSDILSQEQTIVLHIYSALLDDNSSPATIITPLSRVLPYLTSKFKQLPPSDNFLCVAHVLSAALTRCLDDVSLRNILVDADIVPFLCKILFELKKKSVTDGQEDIEKETVKASLQVLYNLFYRCRTAQDALLACDGLPVILTYCATDFANPLSREWALLCIRNACENNEAVQMYIEQLQPQGVIQDEAMAARGLRVELDAATGKFVFKQDGVK